MDEQNVQVTQALWIVWSNEHRAFWAPNRCGYTQRIEKAGRYTREEAESICRDANYRANSTINVGTPPEICMPAPEALDHRTRAEPDLVEVLEQAADDLEWMLSELMEYRPGTYRASDTINRLRSALTRAKDSDKAS